LQLLNKLSKTILFRSG